MSGAIYSGVEAMVSSQKRMNYVANNLANASTTAFKRQTPFVHTLERAGRGGGKVEELEVKIATDFSQGGLDATGNPLHLALEGKGFFGVEGENGEVYTRVGIFELDTDGTLTTADGLPVAWEQLRGAIDPTGAPIEVGAEGLVSQRGVEIGRLRIVDFQDDQRLTQDALGYYNAPLDLLETAHTATVRQGHLEGSNVAPMDEMVAMIAVQRAYAGASNLLGMINETYRRLSRVQ